VPKSRPDNRETLGNITYATGVRIVLVHGPGEAFNIIDLNDVSELQVGAPPAAGV
jgi:hypothetical protein